MPQKYTKPVYERDIPWWTYDAAIAFGIVTCAWLASAVSPLFALPLLILLYGSFVEPHLLTVKRYEIDVRDRVKAADAAHATSRKLSVAFISDIHVGPYKDAAWVRRVVERTNALAPDLVLLGGDFLHKEGEAVRELEPLKDLKAPLGVFAILGNHDEWKAAAESKAWFEASGIPLLLNRSVRAKDGVRVAGADDDWYGETDLAAAFREIGPEDLAIVMLHNPDLAPPAAELLQGRAGKTVFFCGHAHGGQIRLPFIGPVPRLPHHLGRTFDRGLFSVPLPVPGTGVPGTRGTGMQMVLGVGVGESGPRARLFCPPEIVFVTVRY